MLTLGVALWRPRHADWPRACHTSNLQAWSSKIEHQVELHIAVPVRRKESRSTLCISKIPCVVHSMNRIVCRGHAVQLTYCQCLPALKESFPCCRSGWCRLIGALPKLLISHYGPLVFVLLLWHVQTLQCNLLRAYLGICG